MSVALYLSLINSSTCYTVKDEWVPKRGQDSHPLIHSKNHPNIAFFFFLKPRCFSKSNSNMIEIVLRILCKN